MEWGRNLVVGCWFWFGFGVFWMMPSSSLGRGGGMEERGMTRGGGGEGGKGKSAHRSYHTNFTPTSAFFFFLNILVVFDIQGRGLGMM
ncbi:hypothetical protein VFPBJ_05803 [Purpureocillium lilacinum]|uniref:Uncharacterized protein n=1 Tax=Purpureocillium lilacinum TaxID=33203 RepID=A0A179GRV3_PURLI|nr:hypothetical protein VFPBJ_05803 [Purpureocillium lilacinum]